MAEEDYQTRFCKLAIRRSLREHLNNPSPDYSFGVVADDMYHLEGTITGPPGSPYEGGIFFVDIRIPPMFPIKPPRVSFRTPVFNPNVSPSGNIYNPILMPDRWCPAFTLSHVLMDLTMMLARPAVEPEDMKMEDIAQMYREDRAGYESVARAWTMKHAMD